MNKFEELLTQLKNYPNSLPPNEVHGFLTAANIAPEASFLDLPWMQTLLGLPTQTSDIDIPGIDKCLILLAMHEIKDQLLENEFIPVTTSSKHEGKLLPDTHDWARGFLKVIAMHPKDWEAMSEHDQSFAYNILEINTLSNPEKFTDLAYGDSVNPHDPEFIQEIRLNAGTLAQAMFDKTMETDFLSMKDEQIIEEINQLHKNLSPENLSEFSNDELYDLLFTQDDRLPLSVIDEFVHREQQILPLMASYTDELTNWVDDYEDENLWPLLHHIFILGKMSSQEAARQLLTFLTKRNNDIYDSRWDWLAGYWPALFDSKTRFVEQRLLELITDPEYEDDRLYDYFSILLVYTKKTDSDAFESVIDILAQRLQSMNDRSLVFLLANILLDYPSNRHRELLENLAKEQDDGNPLERFFSFTDVENAFLFNNQPEYERFTNPWNFYDHNQIIKRQLRWLEEDQNLNTFPEEDEALNNWTPNYEPIQTYIREKEKIGRNDPCPCGSGKKYKKCCLH